MRLDAKHLGSAQITTEKEVVAGSVISMTLVYTVGAYGMDDSGNLRIAWRSISDWEAPQFEDPKGFGFTTVTTDGNAVLHYKKSVHQRPFHNALDIKVRDGDLHEGDKITVVFGDRSQGSPGIRVQTFSEEEHEFRVYADPLNTCRFEILEEIPTMRVVSGPINEVQVVNPSYVEEEEAFSVTVRVLDEWGNPCKDFSGEILLSAANPVNLPAVVNFTAEDQGFVKLDGVTIDEQGVYHIQAEYPKHKISGLSNGITCRPAEAYNLFWGDAHGQTSLTIGTGSLDSYFGFAKGPAALDFTGWQGNDFEITPDKWEHVKERTKAYHKDHEFVTFLGYEWSGNYPGGGDHNVYYLGDDADYYPHCNWSSGSEHETNDNNCYPLTELMDRFRGREDVLVTPHIGGRPANLDYYDPEFIKVIEIHSHHGTFEWFAREAMERGLKVGFIATSDDHTCRPGLSYPLQDVKQLANAFDVANGFTAVYAKDLTREGIWEAIKARRVYATTFARIALDVKIDGNYMGSECTVAGNPTVDIDVVGTAPLKSVEVIRGTETLYKESYTKETSDNLRQVKIMWEGVLTKGRRKSTKWDGTLNISKGKIVSVKTLAFDRIEQGVMNQTNQWIEWNSTTSGDMDGLLLEIDAPEDAIISFNTNPVHFSVSVKDLSTEPKRFEAGGVNLNATVERIENHGFATYSEATCSVKTQFTDDAPQSGVNPYWVKVVQEDGHMAWSSPIFVTK